MKTRKGAELDKEEKELLDSLERGEWQPVDHQEEEKARLVSAARAMPARKDKRVNIRMTERDLQLLQQKAEEEGLPYQTLISSVLHKYVTGRLVG